MLETYFLEFLGSIKINSEFEETEVVLTVEIIYIMAPTAVVRKYTVETVAGCACSITVPVLNCNSLRLVGATVFISNCNFYITIAVS